MHYEVIVVIESPPELTEDAIKDAVSELLMPFEGQHWDWWQIGGRWTGALDGYDPEADPALVETCELCGGTGNRAAFRDESPEEQHSTGCNGCLGKGTRTKWPTGWPFHAGDVQPVASLRRAQIDEAYAVVVDRAWTGGENYEPWHEDVTARFVPQPKAPLDWIQREYPTHLAVIVDCHN